MKTKSKKNIFKKHFASQFQTPNTVCGVCLEEDGAEIIEAGMDVNKAVVRDEDLLDEIGFRV
jgi:hypothetical protein